jgi:hypothetical protein
MSDWMTAGFLGYGHLCALLWLLGMEEHCQDEVDAENRLALLPTFPLTMSLSEAHRRYGYRSLPRGVLVWRVARQLAMTCGLNPENIGEVDGDFFLPELLPLPRPTNESWPRTYEAIFPSYPSYEKALLAPRVARYLKLIVEYAPRVVVVHGARYHDKFAAALVGHGGVRMSQDVALAKNKPAHIVDIGNSKVVLIPNLGRSTRWSTDALAMLARLVGVLWRGEPLDEFKATSPQKPIELLLAGMFHHRMGNVLPREVANTLRGFTLNASKSSVLEIVARNDFRGWATQSWRALGGRTPVEACIARDLSDLHDGRNMHTRLRKRYGGNSTDAIHTAVMAAHTSIRAWQAERQ